jgi:hypothetical protein
MPKKLKKLAGRHIKFTGELAQAWIDHDAEVRAETGRKQRPLTKSNVTKKFEDMMNDTFVTTSQGPTIDWDGAVIDGQHQLNAIVRYYNECEKQGIKPTPIDLFVKEGENPDHFPFYDLGKPRSGADVFAIEGIEFPKEMSYAARLLWIRYNGKRVAGAGRLSPYALDEFAKEHPGLKKSCKYIMEFGTDEDSLPCKELMSPGYATALHYLMVNADDVKDGQADEFWRLVIEQEGEKNTAPFHLVKKIKKADSDKEYKLSRDALVDLTIHAFNQWCDGVTGTMKQVLNLEAGDRPELGGYDGAGVVNQDD